MPIPRNKNGMVDDIYLDLLPNIAFNICPSSSCPAGSRFNPCLLDVDLQHLLV